MVVLHKFPRALYCKTLMDKSFSKTPTKDWDCEYLFVIFSLLSLLSYNFFFLFRNYGQVRLLIHQEGLDWEGSKSKGWEGSGQQGQGKATRPHRWLGSSFPSHQPSVAKRANPGPQHEGSSKRRRVESMPLVVTSSPNKDITKLVVYMSLFE